MDQFKVRRSGRQKTEARGHHNERANQQDDDEPYIFDVSLTPDDFRPGTRNKKLDSVDCSS